MKLKDRLMLLIAMIWLVIALAIFWAVYVILYIPLKLIGKDHEEIFDFDTTDQRID